MIHVLIVGDGPRDEAVLPAIVATLLNTATQYEFRAWRELRETKKWGSCGYRRKFGLALLIARQWKKSGLIAVVDRDTAPKNTRLNELHEVRGSDRERHPHLSTALGEADPHVEAWLLDDAKAVRSALGLPTTTKIPPSSKFENPKRELDRLIDESNRKGDERMGVLADIGKSIMRERCLSRDRTGFQDFIDDICAEFETPRSNP